jgi:large subunit ribosomal protein L29
MKYTDIKELTTKELKEIVADDMINYTKIKIAHAVSPLDNHMRIKELRKKIARIKTELRKRELSK